MNPWPDTESTLVRRLGDPRDDEAWSRFDSLYRPVIYRYARSRGLQHADAETLVGEVMSRVFRAAERWSQSPKQESLASGQDTSDVMHNTNDENTLDETAEDSARPQLKSTEQPTRFRAWLCRVAENALLNLVTRQLSRRGTGGTSHQISLSGRPIADDDSRSRWELEHRQHVFLAAAGQVKTQVDETQWQLFWKTHVDGVPIPEAADQAGSSIGMAYAIRSRILKRLRDAVARIERLDDPLSRSVNE